MEYRSQHELKEGAAFTKRECEVPAVRELRIGPRDTREKPMVIDGDKPPVGFSNNTSPYWTHRRGSPFCTAPSLIKGNAGTRTYTGAYPTDIYSLKRIFIKPP